LAERTQGFSPHPKLALCPPLPVGVIGLGEPADFWFVDWEEDSLRRWRKFLPSGIDIISARIVDGPSLNKLCAAAAYSIEPLTGAGPNFISDVLSRSLKEMNALLRSDVLGGEVVVATNDLERCGPSYMVKKLVESSVISAWSDISIARTAVGLWNEKDGTVAPVADAGAEATEE
jgi:hypothetical protein